MRLILLVMGFTVFASFARSEEVRPSLSECVRILGSSPLRAISTSLDYFDLPRIVIVMSKTQSHKTEVIKTGLIPLLEMELYKIRYIPKASLGMLVDQEYRERVLVLDNFSTEEMSPLYSVLTHRYKLELSTVVILDPASTALAPHYSLAEIQSELYRYLFQVLFDNKLPSPRHLPIVGLEF